MSEEFAIADNLDLAWSNFDPFFTLPANCPYHVEREGKPLDRLKRALLRENRQLPKYFFSGHRGCGKSTELNNLHVDEGVNKKYFIVKYSVKEVCDVYNLNYIDVLFSIGAQLYIQYLDAGKALMPELITELEAWKNTVVEQTTEKKTSTETSGGLAVKAFFLSFLAKIKSEDATRETIRKKIEPRLSDLIDKINMIISDIKGKERKEVLVVIDDLDKPSLEQAKKIFYDNYTAITQPSCAIVYTVPISMYFAQESTAIKESKFFLPNIKLHVKNDRNNLYEPGYRLMKSFVFKRMQEHLIKPDALNLAIKMGAGVFRETARIIQIAADSAIENKNERNYIAIQDVQRAVREIRSDFKRILKMEDYETLKGVFKDNEIRGIEKIGHLLHNLSILEYVNDETWYDVHPTLEELAKS
ncbi:MAG: ATPase domain protein [Candidatus Brocadiaceae bacterium]|nr:ATPase domain protein [Candidatus Brocadiaceae bacterium]